MGMTNSLIFIRHAETDMAGRFCGQLDPPINNRGRQQVQKLLKTLEQENIELVYTSDLQRATSTAEALAAQFHCSSVPIAGLREIAFGQWEGLSWQDVEARDATYARRWSDSYPQLAAPGGEEFQTFQSRVLAAVEDLIHRSEKKRCAVVSHAGVMRTILCTLCKFNEKDAWEQTKEYCSFVRYTPKDNQ